MDTDHRTVELAVEQAIEWLEKLRDPRPGDHAAFMQWLKTSPLNVREMLLASELDRQLRSIDPGRATDVQALLAEISSNVIPVTASHSAGCELPRRSSVWQRARRGVATAWSGRAWKVAAGFAVITLSTLGVWAVDGLAGSEHMSTAASEWHTKLLSDGSRVRMGPLTELRIVMSDERRVIELLRGEALFQVAKDAQRPFIVHTARAEARALGTVFAVSQHPDQVLVTVEEGSVSVRRATGAARTDQVRLTAGQQVGVTPAAPLTVKTVDVDVELAWATGRILLKDSTVAEAIAAFNRLNRTQIELDVDDPEIAATRIVGVFDAADPEGLVSLLTRHPWKQKLVRVDEPGVIRIATLPTVERVGR